jgi:L-fuculose-phosphate aldolase
MGEQEARAELVRAACALDGRGMMPAKSGNLSLRWGDGFLVTPAALPYARMTPEDIVAISGGAPRADARHRPSSEWRLHAAILAARPEVGAVVHTHSPRATALSCARRGIPAFHYMLLLAGGALRCAEHATFGTSALAESCLAALAGRRAALLANHGVVAVGATLAAAETLAMEVENWAGQYLDLLAAGLAPVLLDEAEMAEAAAQFAAYGRN